MTGAGGRSDREGSDSPERARGSGGRRALNRALRIGGAALGLVVVLYGAAAILLHALLDPETVAGWVEPRAEAALNRDVELEGARLRIFPRLAAEVRGIRVENLPDFEGPPLAAIESVRLEVAILPLFRGRIRIDEVRVVEPAVRLAVDAEGRSNYGDLVPESREPGADDARGPLRLALRRLELRGGSLSYVRAPDSVRIVVGGLRADASLESGPVDGWSGELQATSDSLVLAHPALGADPLRLHGPGVEARGVASGDMDRLELRQGSLRLGGTGLDLSGEIEGLKQPVRRVALTLRSRELDVGELASMVPAAAEGLPERLSGVLDVDLRVEGPAGPDDRPGVRGRVTLASVGLRGPGDEALLEDLAGRIELEGGEVSAREISGTVLGGAFGLEGTLRADSTLAFGARVTARPELEAAAALAALPEDVALEGRLDVRLSAAGELRRPGAARLDGRLDASGVRVAIPAMAVPATVERARLDFRDRSVSWREVVVGLGDDRVSTSGSLEDGLALLTSADPALPRLDADVRSTRLDLDAVSPSESDPAVTYGRLAFAHLGGRSIRGRSAAEWAEEKGLAAPDSLPVIGEARVRVDTLLTRPYRLTDVRARVVLSPDLMEVRDASFGLYGGRATSRLSLGTAAGESHPFSLDLDVRDVVAADFLEFTSPLGGYVRGTLSLGLQLAGEVDERLLPVPTALAGSGRLQVRDGGLAENPLTRALSRVLGIPELAAPPVTSWSAPFQVEATRLRFADASLATTLGELRYGGVTGLDGSLDLGLGLALPAGRLDSLALSRSGVLSAVAGRLTGDGGPVALGLSVGGTLRDPRIGPRASLVTDDLRRALLGEIDERTRTLRDTARARLDAARDTATARVEQARDTVRTRMQETRDTGAERLEAERREAEERARSQAEEARRELQDRARDLLRGLRRPRDTTSGADTTGPPPP